MKKLLWLGLLCLFTITSFANIVLNPQKKLTLYVTFDWHDTSANVHAIKKMLLNSDQQNYAVVASDTKVEPYEKFPQTWALLLKPSDLTKDTVTANFLLVSYGLNHAGTIIMSPRIIFKKNQKAEILVGDEKARVGIKVLGTWV